MITKTKLKVSSLLENNNYDIVILMNNSTGNWNTDASSIAIKNNFPKSYGIETATNSNRLLKLGTYETPVKEEKRKEILLNVHTRLTNSQINKCQETEHLEKALSYLAKEIHGKRILIVSSPTVNIRMLTDYSRRALAGNKVTVVDKK